MAATRDQIMKLAIQHLNESPTASMAQLAEAAGISRATLHRHFSNRDDLMLALAHRAHDQWERLQLSSGIVAATASGDRAALERAMDALLVGLIEVADEYGFGLTDDRLATHPELKRRADELEEREVAFYAAAQRAGLLRPGPPARWISNVVFGLLVAVRESLRNGDVARRDVPELLIGTFQHGAAPQQGER
ncbi:TetR/AcrR family transcriptional regulator [Nonomuraea gerenzanensis]|uniref:Transcriptional regulator, TetR family n=1 Tax=Nonomuraea gerenzanensis TaxID=93944 RepID=A0A1M4EIN9_9ACTN|nr:TetR/AcrR family transcriptional regulator [Nonomuraea gerenzanensis]UBU10385.1 TetR/AcrR family transcriptional regulator [Nonomuraea gerenzanensis]SBO98777.1 Transcriptional regulator, TetR family [Nonomuraea gerenzanensis]